VTALASEGAAPTEAAVGLQASLLNVPGSTRYQAQHSARFVGPCLAIVMAMVIAGCATSSSSNGGNAAAPSVTARTPAMPTAPSASGAPTPTVSAVPTASPTSLADALETIPPMEGALNAIWIGDGAVVVGGFSGPVFSSTILVFEAGSWSVADVPAAPGQVTGIARLGDRLIAVGNGLPDIRNGFIWDSADGRVWQVVQTIEDAALYDVIAGEGVVVAVGSRLDAEMNATASAWSSSDGRTWNRAKVADSAKTTMGSVTTTPRGFAAIGDRPLGVARPFWTSPAATTWAALENDLGNQLLPIDLVQWGDRLAVVGASGKSGDQHPFVALSADGQQWDQTVLSTDEGYASAVALADERLVVGGVDADRLTLWSLRDGDWRADTYEQSGASISALTWDDDWGLVAAGARDGQPSVWAFGNQ
jgi:hypothetical protein